jgi:TatD DNase family protein
MMLFDSHTHLDMPHFKNDLREVLDRARKAGVVGLVSSSIGLRSFQETELIRQRNDGYVFHSAGCAVSQLTTGVAEGLIELFRTSAERIVAIGEVGLDYHWVRDEAQRRGQEPLFKAFIELASELAKPIVIHSRKAEVRAVEILEQDFQGPVLMHCFDGPKTALDRVRENGWYITLPANFNTYRNRLQAAKALPIEQILLETDGPFLSPVPGRNEPANLRIGCEFLAIAKNMDAEEAAAATTRNAQRFYRP